MLIDKGFSHFVPVVAPTAEVKKMDPDPGWRMAGPRLTTSLLTTEFPIPEHSSGKLLKLGKVSKDQKVSKYFCFFKTPKRDRNFWRISYVVSKMSQIKLKQTRIVMNSIRNFWYSKAPLSFWFDPFWRLGQKSFKTFGPFWGNGVSRKIDFDISWPLEGTGIGY